MKILWVKSDFLHPTSRGGQIRTLETVRRLHAKHEVHYIAFDNAAEPEGLARAKEYCSYVYPVKHDAPPKNSPRFALQVASSLFSPLPLAVGRWTTAAMKQTVAEVRRRHDFDSVVCDFLAPALNFPSLAGCVLFQHNVETMIWRRHTEHASDPLRRAFLNIQAKRMFACEKKACTEAAHIIAVSEADARMMREMFGVTRVTAVPTGVDIDYFARPAETPPAKTDLVFVGSMDWMPNTDGVHYFVREILPLIRKSRPDCTLTVVGRKPSPDIQALADADSRIRVTGTVPDVRPCLWDSRVSIVPLRIGGGTRLKIYESMAAGVPVVSTTVGAEGLDVTHPENIRLADTPNAFAAECLQLLSQPQDAARMAASALHLVTSRFSWDRIAQHFEDILASASDVRRHQLQTS
jgi:glycosyltransferase involved in cell wall biosynthesis